MDGVTGHVGRAEVGVGAVQAADGGRFDEDFVAVFERANFELAAGSDPDRRLVGGKTFEVFAVFGWRQYGDASFGGQVASSGGEFTAALLVGYGDFAAVKFAYGAGECPLGVDGTDEPALCVECSNTEFDLAAGLGDDLAGDDL